MPHFGDIHEPDPDAAAFVIAGDVFGPKVAPSTGASAAATPVADLSQQIANRVFATRAAAAASGAAGITALTGDVAASGSGSVAATWNGGTANKSVNYAPTNSLASAASVAIGAATANAITITGTTTITSFDTIADGAIRFVTFSGALTLTHNAASLILPGAANITTAANDNAIFKSLGAGNWRCLAYAKASGNPIAGGGLSHISETFQTTTPFTTTNAAEQLAVTDPTATTAFLVLTPKGLASAGGTGLILGPMPDGTTTGGDNRGVACVDLVFSNISGARAASSRVCKGIMGFMAGGYNHSIANNNSNSDVIVGGFTNTIVGTGPSAIISGQGSTVGTSGTSSNGGIFSSNNSGIGGNSANAVIVGGNANTITNGASAGTIVGGTGSNINGSATASHYAAILGGRTHTISATTGTVHTIVGGFTNTISSAGGGNYNSIFGGQNHTLSATGDANVILGGTTNTITAGSYNVVVGSSNTASGSQSFVMGANADDRGASGARVHAYGQRAAKGDAQHRRMVLRVTTTNATVTPITANAAAASATDQLKLPTASVIKVRGQVTCINIATMDTAGFDFSALLKNNAGTVSVVGTPTVTQQAADAALLSTAVTITADNTNKCVSVNATGIAATTLQWVAVIESVEAA